MKETLSGRVAVNICNATKHGFCHNVTRYIGCGYCDYCEEDQICLKKFMVWEMVVYSQVSLGTQNAVLF